MSVDLRILPNTTLPMCVTSVLVGLTAALQGTEYSRGRAANILHPQIQAISISWDNPEFTPPTQCRYDVCIIVPADVQETAIMPAV